MSGLVVAGWFFFDCAISVGRHGAEPRLVELLLYPTQEVCEVARTAAREEGQMLYACLPADADGGARAWAQCEKSLEELKQWGGS